MTKSLLLILLSSCGCMLAQDSDPDSLLAYNQPARPQLQLSATYGVLSSKLSLSDFLKASGRSYLDDDDKNGLLPAGGPTRIGFQRQFSAGYEQPGYHSLGVYKPGYGFSIGNTYYNSGNLSEDLFKLLLFGNQPYEGETLDLGNSKAESWYYSYFSYGHELVIDSARSVRLSGNILVGHDHRYYKLSTAELYTAANGEYLDVDADYHLQEIESPNLLAGLGASFGVEGSFSLSKCTQLKAGIENLGVMLFTGSKEANVDSSFRFRGYVYSNLFDLSDSLSSAQGEEYRQRFLTLPRDSYLKLTPFNVALQLDFKKDLLGRRAYLRGEYLYLAGFFPRLSAGLLYDFRNEQLLDIAISGGGFMGLGMNLAYQARIGTDLKLGLRINNISSLLLPFLAGGAQATAGISYQL